MLMLVRGGAVLFTVLALSGAATEGGAQKTTKYTYLEQPCDEGWNHNPLDDTCNKVFPRLGHFNETSVNTPAGTALAGNATTGDGTATVVSYEDAVSHCESHRGWVPAIQNKTGQLTYLMKLFRHSAKPGSMWWIGVEADPAQKRINRLTGAAWVTPKGRYHDFLFKWDGSRQMPNDESCVVMHMVGDKTHVGGNDRMITVDCYERHHVVCTKPRVNVAISVVDNAAPGRVEVLYGYERKVYFGGAFIPKGTQVTMQTTDSHFGQTQKKPTHCSRIHQLEGASVPRLLNITGRSYTSEMCNGGDVCEEASISFPADWPWVRGAQYSFCFFVPVPFALPEVYGEWTTEFTRSAYIEVVQKHTDYLSDICLRRQANVNLFYGDGRTDADYSSPTGPWYFDSPVESGGTPLNRPLP